MMSWLYSILFDSESKSFWVFSSILSGDFVQTHDGNVENDCLQEEPQGAENDEADDMPEVQETVSVIPGSTLLWRIDARPPQSAVVLQHRHTANSFTAKVGPQGPQCFDINDQSLRKYSNWSLNDFLRQYKPHTYSTTCTSMRQFSLLFSLLRRCTTLQILQCL